MTTATPQQVKPDVHVIAVQTNLGHFKYWSTSQVCQRLANISSRTLLKYRREHCLHDPHKIEGMEKGENFFLITEVLAWEVKVFGFSVFPERIINPDSVSAELLNQL